MASITCGKCESTHESVSDVRKCFGALPTAEVRHEEDVAVVPPSGANFFLTNTAQVLHDHAQREKDNPYEAPLQRFVSDNQDPTGRIYISCPYDEKDEAKALGARWDADRRSWYVPAGVGLAAFARWRGGQSPKESSPGTRLRPAKGTEMTGQATIPVTEDGMYKAGDQIFKVQWNREKTNLYAKALQQDDDGSWYFSFIPGGLHRIRPENKMTFEEAKEFGALYGTCCVCGRTLTNEDSIERGIGPICADKGGWT